MTDPTLTMPAAPFVFDATFEAKIAALVLRDDRFAREAVSYLKPDHFTSVVDRNLVSLSQVFVERYKSLPTPETLILTIKGEKRILPEEQKVYVGRLIELLRVELKEREFIREKVVDFCKRQAVLIAGSQITDLMNKPGGLEKIRDNVSRAFQIGESSSNQFYDYFEETERRLTRRNDLAAGTYIPGISTGYVEIDKHLYHKGWGRGELSVIMAPSKRGKTALMMGSGISTAVLSRNNVLYISLEVDTDIISDRSDAMLSGTDMMDLINRRNETKTAVDAYRGSTGKFWIERRPSNSMTTDQVEACIEGYLNAGHRVDMVVVDYIGILRLKPADDRFVGLGNAAKELRRIAGKFNVAMVTGAQTNRDAVGKQVAGMDSIGESFAIVQDCDLLMSINANEAEMSAGVRRLFIAASRNSPEVTIKVQGDLSKMQMIQKVLEVSA